MGILRPAPNLLLLAIHRQPDLPPPLLRIDPQGRGNHVVRSTGNSELRHHVGELRRYCAVAEYDSRVEVPFGAVFGVSRASVGA